MGVLTLGVQQLLKDPSKGKYYVAEANGEALACLMVTFEWSEWRDGNILWIQSVYVSERFRGRGVYAKLYHHIQQIVTDNPDLKGIRLYVDRTNLRAQETYRKLGMNGEHYQVFEWIK
jgi:ribosomal protein S18 acetylase RimI-like enzyme